MIQINDLATFTDSSEECWRWLGGHSGGRPMVWDPEVKGTVYVYRLVFSRENGPIPDGLTVDHLCNNKYCIRPDHLTLATREENIGRWWRARMTAECRKCGGDEWTYRKSNGARVCKACRLRRRRAWSAKQQEA